MLGGDGARMGWRNAGLSCAERRHMERMPMAVGAVCVRYGAPSLSALSSAATAVHQPPETVAAAAAPPMPTPQLSTAFLFSSV